MSTYHRFECKILALLIGNRSIDALRSLLLADFQTINFSSLTSIFFNCYSLLGSGMSVLSTVAFRMITQDGLKKCLEIYKGLKGSSEANKIDESGSPEVPTKLSKSAKRRQRKKKLKESGATTEDPEDQPPENGHANNSGALEDDKLNLASYDLVTNASKRSAEDFLHRTLMAAFLVKCLQRVGFFESPSKINGTSSVSFNLFITLALVNVIKIIVL